MKKHYFLIILLAIAFISQCYGATSTAETKAPTQVSAAGDLEDIWKREKLTGDWYGLRTDLAEHGVSLDLRLSQFYQAVTSGGANTNAAYGGKFDYILKIDGQKLGLWPGFFATIHAETQFGNSITSDAGAFAFPNTAMLWPLPDYRGTAISGVLVEQALSKNFVLAGGKINVLDLWTMVYPHTGAGQEGFMNTNMVASALPWFRWVNLSVMGGGALFLADDGQIQGGVVVFDSQNSSTTTGFDDMFEDGTAVVGLWRFFFEVGGKPGSLLFAGGTSSRDYDSLESSDWGFVPGVGLTGETKDDAWTTAVYYDQVFWQAPDNAKKNMRFFTGWSLSDGDPSFGRWGGFASVEGWGLLQNREKDRMGVGAFYNQLSSDFKNLTSDIGIELRNLWGAEIYYNAEITPSFHLTPNLQLVSNQNESDSTAVILGVRAVMDF
ncbi:MAG: carbohydrate porin [Planctomycetota bacterium]|jgi:porin